MTSPDELRHLIDRCSFASAKSAYFNVDDIQWLVYVKPPLPLEDVAALCVNGDKTGFADLQQRGDIVILNVDRSLRTEVRANTYMLDSDYVDVLLMAPFYLVQAEAHFEGVPHAIDVDGLRLCRDCRSICGADPSSLYFPPPYNYADGCREYCLSCWLDTGNNTRTDDAYVLSEAEGDLLKDYANSHKLGYHLAVMPVARLHVEFGPVAFPRMVCFFPKGMVELDSLGIIPNDENSRKLSERASYLSKITQEVFDKHSLVVFPCWFDWAAFRKASHKAHLELIKSLSEIVDVTCLNLIRFRQCSIEPIHALPARAGQIDSNPMMSGVLLYNAKIHEARIIGGDAFAHIVTRGLGLPLDGIESAEFPKEGEVGKIVNHALASYSTLIESNSSTAKFVQCLNLLEFLASPTKTKYQSFEKGKKIIARYVAQTPQEYDQLLRRLTELTGNKVGETEKGFRTLIVHMGKRLESIVPSILEREELFLELGVYIKAVIDHMIEHSDKSWAEYEVIRDTLRPFENKKRQDRPDVDHDASGDGVPF